jgi:alpha-D-ribose 1-methylphosphonate 5-triphosphate diphosphatase
METAFRNARVVTPEDDFIGSVLVRDGIIHDVSKGTSSIGQDCDGDMLIPGVIDMHTDALEKHYFPRPKIDWNPISAAITHDAACLSVGVTTIFDSLTVGTMAANTAREGENMNRLIDGLHMAKTSGMLKADHRIHWRCETTSDDLTDRLPAFASHPMTSIFSLMDHTPGQRQYRNIELHLAGWRERGMTDDQVAQRLDEIRARQARNAAPNARFVADLARETGAILASHDDETSDHINQAADLGATIAEFPVTMGAAEQARARGMTIVMGGPNLIRGGSYSGNVPASDMAAAGLLDAFASDYVPRSLIECAFALTAKPFNWSLSRAVATVTATAATAFGLHDRGAMVEGKRADLIRVRLVNGLPVLRGAWITGERVG